MVDNKNVNKKLLLANAIARFVIGILIIGRVLFLSSGSIHYLNAWIFLIAFSILISGFGAYLYKVDKELLQKRITSKEKEKNQYAYGLLTSIAFLGTFVISGLDYRFSWSTVEIPVVIISLFVLIASYGLFVVTLLQNRYASRTIEIQNKQKVIDTGVYSIIRHPLYTAAIFMFLASCLVLGSYFALIPQVIFIVAIILRLKNEEAFLITNLPGYPDYINKVKKRLIPFIW